MNFGKNRVQTKTFLKQQKMMTSLALSEYDIIANFRPLVLSKMKLEAIEVDLVVSETVSSLG